MSADQDVLSPPFWRDRFVHATVPAFWRTAVMARPVWRKYIGYSSGSQPVGREPLPGGPRPRLGIENFLM